MEEKKRFKQLMNRKRIALIQLSINTTGGESGTEFLARHLGSCSIATSVSQIRRLDNNQVNLSPNPASTRFSVEWPNEEISRVELYTITGRLVSVHRSTFSNTLTITVGALEPGMFLVRLTSRSGEIATKRLLVR